MMATFGYYFIACGRLNEIFALASITQLRRYSSLPIVLTTNISPEKRDDRFAQISDITIDYFKQQSKSKTENRRIKLQLYKYSPFDYTFFMDCDTKVVSKRVERLFLLLEYGDIVFRKRVKESISSPISYLYKGNLNISYHGCMFLFKKNSRVRAFFDAWYDAWGVSCKKDMGPLRRVISSGIDLNIIGVDAGDIGAISSNVVRHQAGPIKYKLMGRLINSLLGEETYNEYRDLFVSSYPKNIVKRYKLSRI